MSSPKIIATLTDGQMQLLQSHASIVNDNYFLPFWFKRIERNKFELLPLGNLPPDMCAEISEMRNQIEKKSLLAPEPHPFIKFPIHLSDES